MLFKLDKGNKNVWDNKIGTNNYWFLNLKYSQRGKLKLN